MLFDIPEEDKVCLCYFINYKRKLMVRKDKVNYNVESFIENICSKQTYSRLRKGECIKNNDIYDALLTKLGYRFQYDEQITKKLHAHILKYMPYLSKNKSPLFRKQIKAFLPKLERYQSFALESILYEVCLLVTSEGLDCEDVHHMIALYPILSKDLQEMIGYYILYNIHHSDMKEIPLAFMKASGLYESDNLYIRYMILNILMKAKYFYDATAYCEQALQVCKTSHNEGAKWGILVSKAYLMMTIQQHSFAEVIGLIKKHIDTYGDTTSEKRYFLYHISGIYHYLRKEYDKAWDYIIKIKQHPLYDYSEYILLNHLATILHKVIPEEVSRYTITNDKKKSSQIIYEYYKMKNRKEDLQVLEAYLWKYRNLILEDKEVFLTSWDLIATELRWISKQTGNKKRLYQFHKRKQE